MRRQFLRGAIAAAVLTTTAVIAPNATAATESSAACSTQRWRPWDGGFATLTSGGSIPVRSGPYADCNPTYVPGGSELSLDCRDYNSVGNLWYHGDVYYNGRWVTGWVYSGNIARIYESNGAWCT